MIVSIHQPQFMPWIGYFHKMLKADRFCFLDNVQLKKNEWQNRNRIKTAQGIQWNTVPVRHRFSQVISTVEINNGVDWKRKHLQAIMTHYRKAPFFSHYADLFEDVYSREWKFLSQLNVYLIRQLNETLGIRPKETVLASELDLSTDRTDRLVDICLALGGDTYLSGPDGVKYMNVERFNERDIHVIFHDFDHPVYPQLYGDFKSHLSVVDLLFNCGPKSLKIIESSNSISSEGGIQWKN